MEIANPRHVDLGSGYSALDVELDGITVRIFTEQKPTLANHGVLAVNDDRFTARLPEGHEVVRLTGEREFVGCVWDRELWRLWHRWATAPLADKPNVIKSQTGPNRPRSI